MLWIYLSPHLDDAAYSCGGIMWEQFHSGDAVEIWTVCAGDPPPGPLPLFAQTLQQRWQTGPEAVSARRGEDEDACRILGARQRLFSLPDCIYRRLPASGEAVIHADEELFAPIREEELPLVDGLSRELRQHLPPAARLVSPLTLGGHMDHRLVRAAAEALGRPLYYYADFPYVVMQPVDFSCWIAPDWQTYRLPISRAGLTAWQAAVAAYRSQVSSFWDNLDEMRAQMEAYWRGQGEAGAIWQSGSEPSNM